MPDPEIKFLGGLSRLELQPGDRFVLTVPHALTREQHAHIKEIWAQFVGGDVETMKLLVLDSGMKIGVVSGFED